MHDTGDAQFHTLQLLARTRHQAAHAVRHQDDLLAARIRIVVFRNDLIDALLQQLGRIPVVVQPVVAAGIHGEIPFPQILEIVGRTGHQVLLRTPRLIGGVFGAQCHQRRNFDFNIGFRLPHAMPVESVFKQYQKASVAAFTDLAPAPRTVFSSEFLCVIGKDRTH
ncbi:hypothetical protein D3C87_1627900 [compost metagenome]